MRWIALPLGIVLLLWALFDVFRTLVTPRAARGRLRLSRILSLALWRPWRWVGLRSKTVQARERVLAAAAPFFFFLLLVGWVSSALLGYALILWSPAFVNGIGVGGDSFENALYTSGTALFTLGFGGGVATGWTRAIAVAEGATGLGLFAVVIGYLPVLYQAFNRREVGVLLLDARAGSPPSGPELLHRMGSAGVASSLPQLFAEWERWVADVLETHMSYPILALFRSPHDYTSWVTSLGSVLDAATLILTSVEDESDDRAKLLYGTGVHAVEDLFYYLRLTERESVIQRHEFEDVLNDMKNDGFAIRPVDEAFAAFTEKRAKYAPRLDAIVVLLAAPPGQWIGDRSFLGRTAH
ncbi:MAG TPA: potassium channel family protein [Actinomycetota bacterium]|nr:potassium channel family protein [Actinomycetota bacterium]